MWLAFDVFANSLSRLPDHVVHQELERAGITVAGIQKLLALAHKHNQDEQQQIDEIKERQLELNLLLAEFLDRFEWNQEARFALRDAIQSRNHAWLADRTGRTAERMRDLLAAAVTNPAAEQAAISLVELRRDSSESDWLAFRRFLLTVIVPRTGSLIDFEH
jgi:hypothetical protein